MAEDIQKPLMLNESIKDSVDPSISISANEKDNRINPTRVSINPVEEQQAQQINKPHAKKKKLYTRIQICSVICMLIGLVVILALPPFIHKEIISKAIDQSILQPDNEKLWAHFPGDSGCDIVRNYTFFHLDNEEGFLFFGQKPVFRQISGYKITQLQDFLNITYFDHGNKVKVIDWLRFDTRKESRNIDQKVKVLNMGPLGYWYTLKQARPSQIIQQGLALLVTNLQQSILPTLLGQGINSQYLTNFTITWVSLYSPAGISEQNAQFIWNDSVYGMSDKDNLVFWADAASDCFINESFAFSQDSLYLKNYFTLTDQQTEYIMRSFKGYIDNLRSILLQNHYCDDLQSIDECTGRYLAFSQLASSFVTGNTPPVSTISPNDTICESNVTCPGKYPELHAFYKNVYLKNNPNAPSDLVFDYQLVHKWMDYNNSIESDLNYNTAQNCLLHIGNLDALWQMGTRYDQTKDDKILIDIQNRFGLESFPHTKVFWAWIKYIYNQFVLQKSTNTKLGISTTFASGLYESFSYLQDHLQNYLLKKLVTHEIQGIECHNFFQSSMEGLSDQTATNLCNAYNNSIHNDQFTLELVQVCEQNGGYAWTKIRKLGPTLVQMRDLCDSNSKSRFGSILDAQKRKINDLYNCSTTPNPYCSNFELAALQWSTSVVTKNPPIQLNILKTSTFGDWDSQAEKMEYNHFIQKFSESEKKKFPRFSIPEIFKEMSFDSWFSSPVVLNKQVSQTFDPYFFKYVRYICIFVSFNGFTHERTPRQLMFGYEDQYLLEIKNAYPPFGGDPSVPSNIKFNDPNITKEEANLQVVFLTGLDDFRNVYQNYEISGYKYLTTNYTRFNGNRTYWEMVTPWKVNDYFYGTTAKIFAPNQFEANNLSLLIPQLQRYGSQTLTETFDYKRFGFDLKIGYLSQEIMANSDINPNNDKYYQTYYAVFNATSIYGLPLFVSKNHFLDASTNWTTYIDIYNEDKTIKYQKTSQWDDTFLIIEPYTGVSFQSTIYLQSNYLHEPDELFDYPQKLMLPIFSLYRSGNLTEEKAKDLYAPLILGLKIESSMVYVGIGIAVASLGLLIFATFKKRKLSIPQNENQKDEKKSLMGISLQVQKQVVKQQNSQQFIEIKEDD